MLYHSPFREYTKEIVYSLETKTGYQESVERDLLLVDHSMYRKNQSYMFNALRSPDWEPPSYAFGVVINPFYTRIFVLDYDQKNYSKIIKEVDRLTNNEDVQAIDLIRSSEGSGNTNRNYHIYVGLSRPMNVMSEYTPSHANIQLCYGFAKCIEARGEIVARTSQKFLTEYSNSVISPIESYRRVTANKWTVYTENQILPPLSSINEHETEEHKERKKRLRLR